MKHDPQLTRLLLLNLRDGGFDEQIKQYPEQLVLEQKVRLIDEGLASGGAIKDGLDVRWVKGLRISSAGHRWLEALEASGSEPANAFRNIEGMHAPRNMSHVFISYVHENDQLVDRLCTELRQHGILFWREREQIKPGQRWRQAIREAIENGAFFIACFSTEYTARDSTHMNEELTLAIDEIRKRPTDRAWFIPVLLSNCAVPTRDIGGGETLNDIQRVALWENWSEGINRIVSTIKPAATEPGLAASVSRVEQPMGNSAATSLGLSEQAVFILRQFVESGDDQFFYANYGGGQWALQLCHGEQNQIQAIDPRFIQDDLNHLVGLQLLSVEYNSDGNGIYGITRNAVRLIETIDRKP